MDQQTKDNLMAWIRSERIKGYESADIMDECDAIGSRADREFFDSLSDEQTHLWTTYFLCGKIREGFRWPEDGEFTELEALRKYVAPRFKMSYASQEPEAARLS